VRSPGADRAVEVDRARDDGELRDVEDERLRASGPERAALADLEGVEEVRLRRC
jgi:hypothetical protein